MPCQRVPINLAQSGLIQEISSSILHTMLSEGSNCFLISSSGVKKSNLTKATGAKSVLIFIILAVIICLKQLKTFKEDFSTFGHTNKRTEISVSRRVEEMDSKFPSPPQHNASLYDQKC